MKFVREYDTYNGEDLVIETDEEQHDKSNITDDERTNVSVLVDDNTDEDMLSDLEMDLVDKKKKKKPESILKVEKVPRILLNGGTVAAKKSSPAKTRSKKTKQQRN